MSSCSKESCQSSSLEFLHQPQSQWSANPPKDIDYCDPKETIFLVGGLTSIQDRLMAAGLKGIGYHFESLETATFEAFSLGKIYGNKAQCNPTYFTVGNLIKHLKSLQDSGLSAKEIVQNYAYVTAGGCGPCRFGMYITEYNKALRDAGFEGFRITSFEHDKGIFQKEDAQAPLLDFTPSFFITLIKAVIVGDLINILGYKIRPYELNSGETDRVIAEATQKLIECFEAKASLVKCLYQISKGFKAIKLNRLQAKPKVMIMGEFWASMTEGDGNYGLYRFLESEGAECIPQPVLNRLMLSIWEAKFALGLEQKAAQTNSPEIDFSLTKKRALIALAKGAVSLHIKLYSRILGLKYQIPDIDHLAELAKVYYTLECSGGEGHLEVAHLIESIKDRLSHLVLSVKPFGCMPSSAVSDGVQSLVTARYPEANFLSIETSGEGAANFYSRVQMALFKAKQAAQEEFESFEIPNTIPEQINQYSFEPKNGAIGTGAALLKSLTKES